MLWILNLEGHQKSTIGSKVAQLLMTKSGSLHKSFLRAVFDHLQKFLESKINYKNIHLRKTMKAKWCQNLQLWLRKGAKIAPQKKSRFCVFWSLQRSLLCIVGELAEGGSVAVAVGVSDTSHVTCDI